MEPVLLKAAGAGKVYQDVRAGFGRTTSYRALGPVDFEIRAGETVAIVGRSGAGKSTLARCLAGLEPLTEGELWAVPGVQLVFQDSPTALNPRWTVLDLIGEPLRLRGVTGAALTGRVRQIMDDAGLDTDLLDRRPDQLSGGQRQRVAIARALAVPGVQVLILDEPLTGLDPANQQRITSLLGRIQRQRALGLVYVTHDMAAALQAAGRVVVLENGRVVEQSPGADFSSGARHPASLALLAAMLPDRGN